MNKKVVILPKVHFIFFTTNMIKSLKQLIKKPQIHQIIRNIYIY